MIPEERSPQALDWFEQCQGTLISSNWLITETHSTLGIKPRHHGRCSQLVSLAGWMQQESTVLDPNPALW